MALLSRLAAVAAVGGVVSAGRGQAGNTQLGCNVGGNGARGFHFADLVKQALPFGLPTAPLSQNASVDAAGWPTEDFGLTVYYEGAGPASNSWPPAQINGTYTVTAIGNATVSIAPGLGGSVVLNQSCDASSNMLVAYVSIPDDPATVNGQIQLSFTATARNPTQPALGAGLVNVSLLQPGYPIGTPPDTFAAAALDTYRFCSLIRAMPWTLAQSAYNPSPPSSGYWKDRARVGMPSYYLGEYGTFGPGVPWEVVAAFVNELGTDVWVNVPPGTDLNTTARDEYITNLVTLMDSLLPAGKRIYVEYGNELWNGHFTGYNVNAQLANISVLQDGDPYNLNYGLSSPPNVSNLMTTWAPRHLGWTALHIAQLAGAVVGPARVGAASTPGVRVVPIMGAQGGYEPQGNILVSYLNEVYGPPASLGVATIAIGGYIGMGANDSSPDLTTEEVIDGFFGVLAAQDPSQPSSWCGNPLAAYTTLAAYYGMVLHAYEGSPDTSGSTTPASLQAKANAVLDPRMQNISIGCIGLWQSWGGGTFNWFTGGASSALAPWGSYSVVTDIHVPDTPKAAGVNAVISMPPAPVTAGLPLPVTNYTAAMFMSYYSPTCSALPYAPITYLPVNSTFSYLVRRADPSVSCSMKVTIYMCNVNKTNAAPLSVSVGSFLPPVIVNAPAFFDGCRFDNFTSYLPVTASFPPLPASANANGLVTVRLVVPVSSPDYRILALDADCV